MTFPGTPKSELFKAIVASGSMPDDWNWDHILPRYTLSIEALGGHMPAKAPSRSTGTINISIGMVTLSLALYSSTEESATKRSSFRRVAVLEPVLGPDGQPIPGPDGKTQYVEKKDDNGNTVTELHPVGRTAYDKVTGENVTNDAIIKCVEAADGTLVEVTDEEMQAFLADNGTTEFVGFISADEYRTKYVPERVYQVRPAKVKVGGKTSKAESPFTKPFALFLEAMRKKGSIGLVKHVTRGNPRFYALTPDGRLCSLLFDEEVREDLPLPVVDFKPEEISLGETLIDKLSVEAPVLNDETSTKIAEFVETKAEAMAKGEAVALPEIVAEETPEAGGDLMALLSASLEG